MRPFRLSTTQADGNDMSLDLDGGNWVPLGRIERPKTPFELLGLKENRELTTFEYLLIQKAINGELAAHLRQRMEKAEDNLGPIEPPGRRSMEK